MEVEKKTLKEDVGVGRGHLAAKRHVKICQVKSILVFFLSLFFVPQFPWLWDLIWAIWARHWLAMNIAWKHMSLYSIQGPCTPNWVQSCWDVWWYMESLRTGMRYLSVSLTFIIVHTYLYIYIQTRIYKCSISCLCQRVLNMTQSQERTNILYLLADQVYLCIIHHHIWYAWQHVFFRVLFQGSTVDVSAPRVGIGHVPWKEWCQLLV